MKAHFYTRSASTEKGSIAILTALMLVVIMAIMALGIDVGMMLVQRAAIARAADAAALAGVRELPIDAWKAQAKAIEYGMLNGLQEAEMTVEVPAGNTDVLVYAQREVNLFFARIMGIEQLPVSAKARSRINAISGVRGVAPLGVFEDDFIYGEQYMLKAGAQPGDGVYKGNFGALALGETGASNYLANLKYGFRGVVRVGDIVKTETGDMVGPTAEGIVYRTSGPEAAACSFEQPRWSCPQIVVVPVIGGYMDGGRTTVNVVGFAAFFLEGTTRNGADNYVLGRFLQMVTTGEGHADSKNFGLRGVRLVE